MFNPFKIKTFKGAGDPIKGLSPFTHWIANQNVTLTNGKVSNWGTHYSNTYPSLNFTNTTSSNTQPILSSSTSELNKKPSIAFDGSNDQMISDLLNTDWSFLYNGTGGECFVVCVQRDTVFNALLSTKKTVSNAGLGFYFGQYIPSGSQYVIGNGSTPVVTSLITSSSLQNAGIYYNFSYVSGSTPNYRQYTNSVTTGPQGNSNIWPSGSDASNDSLTLGSSHNVYFAKADIAEIIIFNRILNATERSVVSGYIRQRYGIVSV